MSVIGIEVVEDLVMWHWLRRRRGRGSRRLGNTYYECILSSGGSEEGNTSR